MWTLAESENNWGYCRVIFLDLFIENELFTETGKKAACTSHLTSFPPSMYPSYIHTAALIFHTCPLHIYASPRAKKNIFLKLCHFWEYTPLTSARLLCGLMIELAGIFNVLYFTLLFLISRFYKFLMIFSKVCMY